MEPDACGRAVIDGHEDEGRPLGDRHGGRHVCAPHHVGRLGGDGPVVRLRPMRVARARRGLEVVFAHQPAHPLLRGAHPRDPQLRPGFSVALAMKRRGFEHPGECGPPGRSSGAAPIGPRRRHSAGDRVACRRAYTLERARCHTRQTRCTPYARRVEIDWAPLIASTSAGPKGRRPPGGPPSRTVTRSPSAARRSWPAADGGLRPEHPVRGSLGPPAPQPRN